MKKIIATAIAAAFTAPVMAADVSVGGSLAFILSNTDTAGSTMINDDGNSAFITGTEELEGGMTITGTYAFEDDSGTVANDGSSIVVTGAFGRLGLGDMPGAADSVGDYSDLLSTGMGFGADGDDAAVLWTLPIDQVEVNLSYSPDNVDAAVAGGSIQSNVAGVSVEYSANGLSASFSSESSTLNDEELSSTTYGVRYSANGITVGFDAASEEADSLNGTATVFNGRTDATAGSGDIDYRGFGASYNMGNVTVAMERQSAEQDTTELSDATGISVTYAVGGAQFFAANIDDDAANTETMRAGVRYSF